MDGWLVGRWGGWVSGWSRTIEFFRGGARGPARISTRRFTVDSQNHMHVDSWETSISGRIGFQSVCVRRSYMIVGWSLNVVSSVLLCVLIATRKNLSAPQPCSPSIHDWIHDWIPTVENPT